MDFRCNAWTVKLAPDAKLSAFMSIEEQVRIKLKMLFFLIA